MTAHVETALERIPFNDLSVLHRPLLPELREAFERVLTANAFSGGPEVAAFEDELAACVETTHAVGVGSGTAALHLALIAAGVGPGDEVVLPPNTFFATAEAVVAAGATPVFADVDPDTALLDPDAAAAAIGERTAALIAVHLYGQPADMDRLGALARSRRLFLLEDAAQAIGASWTGRGAGSLGDAGAFSFYPGKNLGALGEAGAVTTNDAVIAEGVRRLRTHGESARYVHETSGFNERMDGLQAAFLRVKLAHFAEAQRQRLQAVARYHDLLADVPGVTLLTTAAAAEHSYHLLVVRVPHRDTVLAELHGAGVDALVHYPTPIHLQPAFASTNRRGVFPNAEALAESIISLPLYPGMPDGHVERAVTVLRQAVEKVNR